MVLPKGSFGALGQQDSAGQDFYVAGQDLRVNDFLELRASLPLSSYPQRRGLAPKLYCLVKK